MRIILALIVAVSFNTVASGVLIEGLTLQELAPAQFSGTTSLSIAVAPTGEVWYSNAMTLFKVNEQGQATEIEHFRQNSGGPLANNSSVQDFAFGSDGTLYILDFRGTRVLKRAPQSTQWEVAAAGIAFPRTMLVAPNGDLIVGAGHYVETNGSDIYRVTPQGEVSLLAGNINGIEAMAFDGDGNIVIVDYTTGLMSRVTLDGVVTEVGIAKADGLSLVESFLVTNEGFILLGINTGADIGGPVGGNTNRLERYDPFLDENIILGINFTGVGGHGFRLPSDMAFHPVTGDLLIAGFGSVLPLAVVGDVDADFGAGLQIGGPPGLAMPEPATAACIVIGGFALASRRQRSRGS